MCLLGGLFAAGIAQQAPGTAPAAQRPKVGPSDEGSPQGKFVVPQGVVVEPDIVYARYGEKTELLNLYRPRSGDGPFPAVVFIHGGGWRAGHKEDFQRQASYLATKGYVCVSIDYRLSQEAHYPAALYDAKAAVRWVRANAEKYHINPNKIAAAGGSAGGQLVAMLGTTSDFKNLEGDGGNPNVSSAVQAVVAFNPLTDFVSMLPKTKNADARKAVEGFFGGPMEEYPELYVQASAVAHVSRLSPPFLFLHGSADTTMPFSQSTEMQQALQAVGVRAELYTAIGGTHGFFNRPQYFDASLHRMEQFLDSVFK